MSDASNQSPDDKPAKPGLFQVIGSILAAAAGVQSDKNRERDFSQGNPLVFIIGGIIFTVVFVLILVGIVMLVVR